MPTDEIQNILEEYFEKHPLALELGDEYIMQDDKAQEDALKAFCDIVKECIP
jgi:hypothetical protein